MASWLVVLRTSIRLPRLKASCGAPAILEPERTVVRRDASSWPSTSFLSSTWSFSFSSAFWYRVNLVQVVPAHRVEVGLADLAREDGLVAVEEGEEVLELEEVLLLDDLGVDVGRPQRLDLGDEEVPYSFDGLGEGWAQVSVVTDMPEATGASPAYLEDQLLQQRPYVGVGLALGVLGAAFF